MGGRRYYKVAGSLEGGCIGWVDRLDSRKEKLGSRWSIVHRIMDEWEISHGVFVKSLLFSSNAFSLPENGLLSFQVERHLSHESQGKHSVKKPRQPREGNSFTAFGHTIVTPQRISISTPCPYYSYFIQGFKLGEENCRLPLIYKFRCFRFILGISACDSTLFHELFGRGLQGVYFSYLRHGMKCCEDRSRTRCWLRVKGWRCSLLCESAQRNACIQRDSGGSG